MRSMMVHIAQLGVLLCFVLFLCTSNIFASEGRFTLQKNTVHCEGISVWKDGQYHVVGRCQGLVYPYAERLTKYILWGSPLDSSNILVRIDTIEDGIIDGRTKDRVDGLVISAEGELIPRKPEGVEIAVGGIEPFPFGTQPQTTRPMLTPTPTHTPTPTLAPGRSFNTSRLQSFTPGIIVVIIIIGIIFIISFVMKR